MVPLLLYSTGGWIIAVFAGGFALLYLTYLVSGFGEMETDHPDYVEPDEETQPPGESTR